MTLPTFVAQNDNIESSSSTITPAVPTGTVEDDVMVAWAASNGHSTADCFVTPAGWTRFVYEHVEGSDKMTLVGYWKAAGASETPTTFLVSGSESVYIVASVESWRGVATATAVDASGSDSNTGSNIDVYLAGLTTTAADCVVSSFGTEWNYVGSGFGAIAGWTTTATIDSDYSGVYRRDFATAGTLAATNAGHKDNDMWLSGTVALKPPAGPPPTTYTVKQWIGGDWSEVISKAWNGSAWQPSPYTPIA